MIKYSILDNTREELSSNITVRLDDTYFKGTIITYDPIKLIDDKIHYSIIFHMLVYNGTEKEGDILTCIKPAEKDILLEICSDVFNDLLVLFKGEIRYDS
jgi:hypothetical protein